MRKCFIHKFALIKVFLAFMGVCWLFVQCPTLLWADSHFSRRVLCGSSSSYTDSHGYVWAADQAYDGDWGYTNSGTGAFYTYAKIENSVDSTLYRSERWGTTPAYRFNVPVAGKYYVKLLFAEIYHGLPGRSGIGARVFDVAINGQNVLQNYDILRETGERANRALIEAFEVIVPESGPFVIDITTAVGSADFPKLSAIEISSLPTLTDTIGIDDETGNTRGVYYKASPLDEEVFRLNCGGRQSLDADKTLWMADEAFALCQRWGYVNGTARVNTRTVWASAADCRHATWREGGTDFQYIFSLPNGQYALKLVFVENEVDTVGQRVFDVEVNGIRVASQLDVFDLVGMETPYEINHILMVTDEQIEVAFPLIQAGQAMISAIEVKALTVSDEDFLDFVEHRSLDYFIQTSGSFLPVNPANGLVTDRINNFESQNQWGAASIAAVGFRLAAICAGRERGWISSQKAEQQILNSLNFINNAVPYVDGTEHTLTHKNGFYFHFLDMNSGQRMGTTELSSIDSALLFAGIITSAQTFSHAQIQALATSILQRANWNWFVNNNPNSFIAMQWKPEEGFAPWFWDGYNEDVIIELIGLGSTTYPLSNKSWFNMIRRWRTDEGMIYITDLEDAPPLFRQIYPQCFVDLRGNFDDKNNYFLNTTLAITANQKFCHTNSTYLTYADGGWGLTSSDSPRDGFSYQEYKPQSNGHDGTVNPTIVGAAVPFAPDIAIPTLRRMYFQYKHFLWGRYGFADSYNLDAPSTLNQHNHSGQGWVSSDVIGIDVGSMLLSIENYRTGFIWNKFTTHSSIQIALQRIHMGDYLIDNFDNDNSQDDEEDERDSRWWVSNNHVFNLSVTSATAENDTPSLRVEFNKGPGNEWAYIAMGNLNRNANMSYYLDQHKLSLHVYGKVNLFFRFRDKNGEGSENSPILSSNTSKTWNALTWNFSDLQWNDCNPRQIQDILIFVQPGVQGRGEFYLDNITLGDPLPLPGAASPTLTPTFTVLPTNTCSPTSTVTMTTTPLSYVRNEFQAFPQPGRDFIQVAFSFSGTGQIFLELYNTIGERVLHLEDQPTDLGGFAIVKILTQDLSQGIYYLKMELKDAVGPRLITGKVAIVK